MSSCGLDTRTELLRSLVDITSCTTFTPNAFVFRTFSDMLLVCDTARRSCGYCVV